MQKKLYDLYVINFILENSISEHMLTILSFLIIYIEHKLLFSFLKHRIQKIIPNAS